MERGGGIVMDDGWMMDGSPFPASGFFLSCFSSVYLFIY